MRFKNFSVWRGRLPHWRADNVTYFVTFRHRRALDERERALLLRALVRPHARKWDLLIVCVLPESTDLMFTVRDRPAGRPYELSAIVEPAKSRAGREIIKQTGERFPPFYAESFDRIIRDEAELEEKWTCIMNSPVDHELAQEPDRYPGLYVPGAPADGR